MSRYGVLGWPVAHSRSPAMFATLGVAYQKLPVPPDVFDETRGGAAIPVGGGVTPAEDGGNPQHPIHDEDQEDRTPGDYERELDRLDAAISERIR